MFGMFSKTTFLAGAAVGYVLGARGGREHFEKIKSFAQDAQVPAPVEKVCRAASDKAQEVIGRIGDEDDRASVQANGHRVPTPAELADSLPGPA